MVIKSIGLRKMGLNIGLNMKDQGYDVLGFDVDETKRTQAKKEGLTVVERLENFFINKKDSIPVITQSLYARDESKDNIKFNEKVVIAIPNEFGGHATYKKEL